MTYYPPPLDDATELEVARQSRRGDSAAGDLVVLHNMLFVVAEANRISRQWGYSAEDLIQEGALVLCRCLPLFDPERGYRFIAFAGSTVTFAMSRRVLRDASLLSGTERRFREFSAAKRDLGADATAWDVLARIGWDGDVSLAMRGVLAGVVALEDGHATHEPQDSTDHLIDMANLRRRLVSAVDSLGDRERLVIRRRWLDDETASQGDVAKELGVGRKLVAKIEDEAMGKLRQSMGSADE